MSKGSIFFVAAEPSGDLLAAEVIDVIRQHNADVDILGIGGDEMRARGISSDIDTAPLSVLGLFEGLKAYGDVVRLADQAAAMIVEAQPSSVVLVDSWGFMLRVAQRLRKQAPEITLIKLVGPQIWATRAGRSKTLAETVDHLLCIHEMEEAYYTPHGLPVTVIGNPAMSRATSGDGKSYRHFREIGDDTKIVVVFPGSRKSEISRVAPALVEAAKILKEQDTDRIIIFSPAANVADAFAEQHPDVSDWAIVETDVSKRYDVMAAADLALACSGTVTTEIAMQGTPMLVSYKTGFITWAIARGFLYKKIHITLLNIASDDTEIVPEFVQTKQQPTAIAALADMWLRNDHLLQEQIDAQEKALLRMKEGDRNSADIAAETILKLTN